MIPDDIRKAAWELVRKNACAADICSFHNGCGCATDIARALMNERERCAQKADKEAAERRRINEASGGVSLLSAGGEGAAKSIAAAIRRGDNPDA
jgi:hypothetical protein